MKAHSLIAKCSNRTIVGLKHLLQKLLSDSLFLQQSHHCGIETDVRLRPSLKIFIAAIAPLWD